MKPIRVPWTSQPQVPTGVDWSNPLTRGLKALLVPNVKGSGLYNVVPGGVQPTTTGTISRSTGPSGVGQKYGDAAGAAGQTYTFPSGYVQTAGSVFWKGQRNGSGPAIFRDSQTNTTGTLVWDNGANAWNARVNGTTLSGVGSFPQDTDTDFLLTGDTSGSVFYVKGASLGSVGTAWNWNSSISFTLHVNTGNAQGVLATDYLVALYDRQLSAAESKSLSNNPWQLFAPISRTIWVPAAAASGTVALTGQTATGTQGTPVASLSLATTGNSSTATQGAVTASLSKAITGNSVTSTQGTVTPSLSLALTGNSVTSTAGTPTSSVTGANTAALTGSSVTATQGTPVAELSLALTGNSATATQGTVTSSVGVAVALTGNTATATQGTPVADLSLGLSGNSATATQGTVDPSLSGGTITVALTGNTITATAGLVGVPDANQYSGGYEHLSRRQTPKQRKEERERLGIVAKDIREATQKVARAVIADTGRTDPVSHFADHQAQFMRMLVDELKGYQPPEMADAISRQIRIAYALYEQEQEEEEILMLLT